VRPSTEGDTLARRRGGGRVRVSGAALGTVEPLVKGLRRAVVIFFSLSPNCSLKWRRLRCRQSYRRVSAGRHVAAAAATDAVSGP
jgi:hypothetical protein